jgi:hypothetical protein
LLKDEDTFSIIWDSGASICITHDTNDFVGKLQSPGTMTYLKGVSKGLHIAGKGQVVWTILDTQGRLQVLKVPVYYVPRVALVCSVHLLSYRHTLMKKSKLMQVS